MQLLARRDDVQVGPYAYRVLRPAAPLRHPVLTHGRSPDGRAMLTLNITRRDGGRLLRLAALVAARTMAAFPLRDATGRPHDLVLVDEALRFPPERWSDVRQRLGTGRITRLTPEPDAATPGRSSASAEAQVATARTATLIYATPDTFRDRVKLLTDGAQTLDLSRRWLLSITR